MEHGMDVTTWVQSLNPGHHMGCFFRSGHGPRAGCGAGHGGSGTHTQSHKLILRQGRHFGGHMTAGVLQAWRGALARRRCRYLRAAYAIMGYYKRHKVKAYLLELIRRFQGVRSMPDFGKSLAWPEPPAVLSRFQENSQQLFRRCEHSQRVSSP